MPIFMDRHELTSMTAEKVAQEHLRDLAIQDRYGVKFLTYWFDEARGTLFCLVEAPDKEAVNRVHQEAHGAVANTVIEVELAAVEAFCGLISEPQPPARPKAGIVGATAAWEAGLPQMMPLPRGPKSHLCVPATKKSQPIRATVSSSTPRPWTPSTTSSTRSASARSTSTSASASATRRVPVTFVSSV